LTKEQKQNILLARGDKTMKNILEDIAAICTLLGMSTAIIMWGSIGQALASTVS
jgi:hypothetical protein